MVAKYDMVVLATLALAGCARGTPPQNPSNAATSSGVSAGQPRAMDEDTTGTTQTTSAEIRAEQEQAPKVSPEPDKKRAPPPESQPDPDSAP